MSKYLLWFSLSVLKMQLIFSVIVFEEYFVYESEGTDLSAVLTCTEQIEKIATVLLKYFNHKNVRTNKLSSEKMFGYFSTRTKTQFEHFTVEKKNCNFKHITTRKLIKTHNNGTAFGRITGSISCFSDYGLNYKLAQLGFRQLSFTGISFPTHNESKVQSTMVG